MKCYLQTLIFFAFIILFSSRGYAQKLSEIQAFDLLRKNASSLNINEPDSSNVIINTAYIDRVSKTTLLYLQQAYLGVPVYNTIQVVVIKNEAVLSVTGNRIAKMEEKVNVLKTLPSVSAKNAVSLAAKSVNIMVDFQVANTLQIVRKSAEGQRVFFDMSPISKEQITSELLWFPQENETVSLAWQVKILPQNSTDYWLILVSARDGVILGKDNLNVSCDFGNAENLQKVTTPVYNSDNFLSQSSKYSPEREGVFEDITSVNYTVIPFPAENMNVPNGMPAIVNDPWLNAGTGNPAITLGWHNDGANEYSYTRGNNVWAKEDTSGNNSSLGAPANSTTSAPSLNFDFPYNKALEPGIGNNLKFAITNLFYWSNIMHDIAYQYGFDEVSGNFQVSNISRGGLGKDNVLTDAQDGSGSNNANFSTPVDGSNPRMQMFLFDPPYHSLKINTPLANTGFVTSSESNLSINNKLINVGPVTGDLVLYVDAPGGSTGFACGAPLNAASLSGKIAFIDRGNCAFTEKILNAQNAGAKGVVIMDNIPGDTLRIMSGEENTIVIPAVFIFQSSGNALKSIMKTQTINVTLQSSGNKLDGDYDNGIIAHEYTHGISNRLTGGPAQATCLQNREQMGEGWSDFFALMMTTDWVNTSVNDGSKIRSIGSYVSNEDPESGFGFRNYPYSTDIIKSPLTYSYLATIPTDKAYPHAVGEVWAACLWDMAWYMIQMQGINTDLYNSAGTGGNSDALKLVTFAMKLQPCSPGFVDGRNAILQADQLLFNGKYECAIWRAFARRGVGINAKQGEASITTDQVVNFEAPSGAVIQKKVDKAISAQNDILTYTFKVTAQCAGITNYVIVDTLATNVTWISGGIYNATNRTVTFNVAALAASLSQTFSFKVKINIGSYFVSSNLFAENIPNAYVPLSLVANPITGDTWNANTTFKSGPYSLKATGLNIASEQTLTSLLAYPVNGHVKLSFWNNFNTEASRDGGVVELSLDNGTTWFDAQPYMVQNGYNSIILAVTSLENKKAFSGNSSGFKQTVINLSSFAGKSLKFRFRYVSDNSVSSTGWFIDDILITKEAAVYNLASLYDGTQVLTSLADTVTALTGVVLPVIWGDFRVEKEVDEVLLQWTTEQEFNTKQFLVERSTDGLNFITLNSIKAAGNSNSATSYRLTDPSPAPGINFYRIAQVDQDNHYSYSETRSIIFSGENKFITLSPNPAKNKITVQLPGNKTSVQIDLLNSMGQKLAVYYVKAEYNNIDLPVLGAGVYYLRIAGGTYSSVKKLIID